MSSTKELLAELIRFPSITPDDAGCQSFMKAYFENLGFHCQGFDNQPVSNFFARIGQQQPLLVFAGHTDVVPPGDVSQWLADPFSLTERDGMLFGRGVADMKGSLAAMMAMAKRFVKTHPHFKGSLGFLITSGEEGDHFEQGTPFVMEALAQQGIKIDYCVVGEPSSNHEVGDVIKVGRRGSLTAAITVYGQQGHVAYPHLANNPIHAISPLLAELTAKTWDQGNDYFPPTSMQITHIQSGGQASNVIPGELSLQLNFRFSTEQTAENLKEAITQCFKKYGLKTQIHWRLNGLPFLTSNGCLLDSTIDVIEVKTGKNPALSTSGGTSDGRFIAPYGVEVIELGLTNNTIHKINECIKEEELESLAEIYFGICKSLLVGKA